MRILLVDDKKAILEQLTPILEINGHTVQIALNGLAAFEKAQTEIFDLYIIDHLMPVMNGIQLSKNLIKNPLTLNVPIIFMTTQNTSDILGSVQNLFFHALIAKPIDEKLLIGFVEQVNVENTRRYLL
ncbi:MAG: response regulator [Colwellia sp.]|nr:response regulator [Colwellia sp.]